MGPKEIWTAEAAPPAQMIKAGDLVQVFVKLPGATGFDSVFVKVTSAAGMKCEGVVVDGPSETRGENLLFDAMSVFDVL